MKIPGHAHREKDGFRLRGLEMSRVDAFSDVVFGFALTLLVVSLEVPKTYAELHESLRGFVPFGLCFYFLMVLWHAHYKFFRRFGLHDKTSIAINGGLLFVMLFYVYPLKFLFTVALAGMLGISTAFFENAHQLVELMVLYGLGFTAIHGLMAALYWNGYRQREHLELNPLEQALTRGYIATEGLIGLVGLVSCGLALALPVQYAGSAGWAYVLVWGAGMLSRFYKRRALRRLEDHAKPVDPNADTV